MIRTAERAAPGHLSEDRVFTTANAVVVLDGVTSTRPPDNNGAWYAQTLGEELLNLLTSDDDLADLLATAITRIVARHDLTPGDSPASTVAITRWTHEKIDTLVLADSPIITFGRTTTVIADTRLAALRPITRDQVPLLRNRPHGYWVAEADPTAAHQAKRKTLPRADVEKVIIATDGVSCAVDDYQIFESWQSVLDLITADGPEAVLDQIRAAELSDPTHTRWPRPKTHDDQALALIDFTA
ncbi:protein phosphatase 2C domain-containing protein [Umezawaea endophytica]|uniref:Protein phosphatase 2C domain-containing protein n=1 Tax=Umezawaea endophytica TaxID=1654476 RepID=A0A9X3AIF8_9PSEU|nr:protein phosphatase 2C domain-containing protein [Umezawaea endophytica]MCS7483077.1 protein phosphatase 2C domain-containing protein [Umezawaea endophytica]